MTGFPFRLARRSASQDAGRRPVVEDPEIDLSSLLAGQPLLILQRDTRSWNAPGQDRKVGLGTPAGNSAEPVGTAGSQTRQSRTNISRGNRDGSRPGRRTSGEPTLPVILDPPDSRAFLEALLRTREAWIEEVYQDGRREVRRWNAARMTSSSNVIRNVRSRPEFRRGEWQRRGITSVRVTIEAPQQ